MTELTDDSGAFGYGESILVGERVRLRGMHDDDLSTLAKWEMDPDAWPRCRTGWPRRRRPAKEQIANWSANEKDDLGFAIETLDDPPVLVGSIHLWGAHPKDRCATVGIALGREYIGRGYGTDAMRVIVGYGFRETGLHRIQLSVAPFNPAGIRAYQKAGFVEEGRQRGSVLHDGRWYDEGADVHPRPRVGGPPITWPMSSRAAVRRREANGAAAWKTWHRPGCLAWPVSLCRD